MRQIYCHWCGKRDAEVARLIEGPATAICNECIMVLASMLSGPSSPPLNLDEFRRKRRGATT
jgi:ATP-dependent protease Clp ATPase subunit